MTRALDAVGSSASLPATPPSSAESSLGCCGDALTAAQLHLNYPPVVAGWVVELLFQAACEMIKFHGSLSKECLNYLKHNAEGVRESLPDSSVA